MSRRATPVRREDLWAKPLQCIPDLLRERGVQPRSVLREAGLDRRVLAAPDNRVPLGQVGRLLDTCVSATGLPHFGLLMGERAGPAAVGVLHELMCSTTTLRSALTALRLHLHLHDRGAVLAITEVAEGSVEIAYVIHHPEKPGMPALADAALAMLVLFLRDVLGPGWTPTRAKIAGTRPKDTAPYRRLFGASLAFGAPRAALVVPRRLLDREIPGANASHEAALRDLISRMEAQSPLSMKLQVRKLLSAVLVEREPSLDRIAAMLGMSRRTLRRRLAEEGTTFTTQRDELKAALARQLLVGTSMSILEIGETLHYSKPGAFSRAYKGWTGGTPQAARREANRGARHPSRGG